MKFETLLLLQKKLSILSRLEVPSRSRSRKPITEVFFGREENPGEHRAAAAAATATATAAAAAAARGR